MRLRGWLLGVVLTSGGSAIAADPVPSLDLRAFHPPTDPGGFLYVEPAATPGPGNANVGAYASYALSPVVLDAPSGNVAGRVIEHQFSIDYYANVGLGKTWGVSLVVPTVVYQTGNDVTALLPGSTPLPHTAIGSIALEGKKTILSPSNFGGLGVAAIGRVYIPTNSRSYVSDRVVSADLRALGELDLLAVTVRAAAGFHLRGAEETWVHDGTDTSRFGDDLPWGAGVTVRPQALGMDRGGHWRWTAEAHGAVALTPSFAAGPQSPVLGALSARYLVKSWSALFGAEFPINRAIGDPLVRPVVALDYAPRFEDADGDGIEDDADQCPELPEDRDGFQDQDGCPDFDNDDDGVPDDSDRCPTEKEDTDGFQDDDGCPDPDNDGDGILDAVDRCPNEKGPPTGPHAGCPDPDPDHDGVVGKQDSCPNLPEDRDGFRDRDGCPDPDNDGDGILDAADHCPNQRGEPSPSPELNGCPHLDHDGDTFDDKVDKCPAAAENFNGVDDEDGCPEDRKGVPLLTVAEGKAGPTLRFRMPLRLRGDTLDPASLPTLRALGEMLDEHPTWIAGIGVRPVANTPEGVQTSLNRAFAIATSLRRLIHRDRAVESLGWGAVKDLVGAQQSGIGVLVMTPKAAP